MRMGGCAAPKGLATFIQEGEGAVAYGSVAEQSSRLYAATKRGDKWDERDRKTGSHR
jgi:hypothetical protein